MPPAPSCARNRYSPITRGSSAASAFIRSPSVGPALHILRHTQRTAHRQGPGSVTSRRRLPATLNRACQSSGQFWIRVTGQEAFGRLVVDERVLDQPLDGPAPGPGIGEGVPDRQQVRISLVELILEPAERSPALNGPRQPPPGPFVGDRL